MKSYKRTFLTNKNADSYIRWDIETRPGKQQKGWNSSPYVHADLKIADCYRVVSLDFGIAKHGHGRKGQLKKLIKFSELMHEFIETLQEAYDEHDRHIEEYNAFPKAKSSEDDGD